MPITGRRDFRKTLRDSTIKNNYYSRKAVRKRGINRTIALATGSRHHRVASHLAFKNPIDKKLFGAIIELCIKGRKMRLSHQRPIMGLIWRNPSVDPQLKRYSSTIKQCFIAGARVEALPEKYRVLALSAINFEAPARSDVRAIKSLLRGGSKLCRGPVSFELLSWMRWPKAESDIVNQRVVNALYNAENLPALQSEELREQIIDQIAPDPETKKTLLVELSKNREISVRARIGRDSTQYPSVTPIAANPASYKTLVSQVKIDSSTFENCIENLSFEKSQSTENTYTLLKNSEVIEHFGGLSPLAKFLSKKNLDPRIAKLILYKSILRNDSNQRLVWPVQVYKNPEIVKVLISMGLVGTGALEECINATGDEAFRSREELESIRCLESIQPASLKSLCRRKILFSLKPLNNQSVDETPLSERVKEYVKSEITF